MELFSAKLSYIGRSEQDSGMAKRLVTAAVSHREYVMKKETKVCGGNFTQLGTLERDCVSPACAEWRIRWV